MSSRDDAEIVDAAERTVKEQEETRRRVSGERHWTMRVAVGAVSAALVLIQITVASCDCTVKTRAIEQQELEYCAQRDKQCWPLYYSRCLKSHSPTPLHIESCQPLVRQ